MLAIRSFLFYLGMGIATFLIIFVALASLPFKYETRYRMIITWTRFNLWWLTVTCNIRCNVIGRENIPEKPGIIMCKHQSALETLQLQPIFIPQVFILKRELTWIPFYGWALAALNPIAIDRGSMIKAMKQVITQGCERLKQNSWVVIYPEGTRIAPGERGKYQPGGGMLAEKSGAMITPVAHNAGYLWPKNSFIKKPGTYTLVIGEPIDPAGKKPNVIMKEVEDWIESTIETLPKP